MISRINLGIQLGIKNDCKLNFKFNFNSIDEIKEQG